MSSDELKEEAKFYANRAVSRIKKALADSISNIKDLEAFSAKLSEQDVVKHTLAHHVGYDGTEYECPYCAFRGDDMGFRGSEHIGQKYTVVEGFMIVRSAKQLYETEFTPCYMSASYLKCPACGKICVAVTGEVNMMSVHVDKADLRKGLLKF